MSPTPAPALSVRYREARAIVHLAVPLALTQLGYMAIITTDVVMMGRIGPDALAAGTLASHFYWLFMLFSMGLLTGATPIFAQHLGARRLRMIRPTLRHGVWLAAFLVLPCGAVVWHAETILVALGQDPEISADGQSYLRYMVWGLLPGLWQVVLAEFLAAHARPRAVLVVTVTGIGLNALADYALMFGNFGFPKMGLDGAGVASALVNTFMFVALLAFVLLDRRLRRYRLLVHLWRIERLRLLEIVRIGLPIAITELAEMGLFLATSLLMGLIGTTALAAHAVAAQCCGVAIMIPIGIAQAGAVRVGRAAGAGDHAGAARAGWTALVLGGSFALLPASAFWFFGGALAGLILDQARPENEGAFGLAVALLAVAAFFQLADALQIVARGVLQGLKDTRVPMLFTLATSWGVGLPAAALLGIGLDLGGEGVWAGIAAAMIGACVLLIRRFRAQARGLAA